MAASSEHPEASTRRPCALVTGGSRGIGAAIVEELARRGVDVAMTYRSSRRQAEELATRLRDEHHRHVLPLRFSMEDSRSAESVVRTAVAELGRLDAVVANAGVWAGGRLATVDDRAWWQVVSVNIAGMRAIAKSVLPALAASRGSLVLVSSVVGLVGFAGDTAYASAKAAMVGFGRSLAKEVGRDGIRVNVLAPGFVDTEMTAAVPAQARERIGERIVLRRFGRPDEIARAAVFLALDASYCTGTVLNVDGGWSL